MPEARLVPGKRRSVVIGGNLGAGTTGDRVVIRDPKLRVQINPPLSPWAVAEIERLEAADARAWARMCRIRVG